MLFFFFVKTNPSCIASVPMASKRKDLISLGFSARFTSFRRRRARGAKPLGVEARCRRGWGLGGSPRPGPPPPPPRRTPPGCRAAPRRPRSCRPGQPAALAGARNMQMERGAGAAGRMAVGAPAAGRGAGAGRALFASPRHPPPRAAAAAAAAGRGAPGVGGARRRRRRSSVELWRPLAAVPRSIPPLGGAPGAGRRRARGGRPGARARAPRQPPPRRPR